MQTQDDSKARRFIRRAFSVPEAFAGSGPYGIVKFTMAHPFDLTSTFTCLPYSGSLTV